MIPKPKLFPNITNYLQAWAKRLVSAKQDVLVSGTNIKTINGSSIIGSGNLNLDGGSDDGTFVLTEARANADAIELSLTNEAGSHTMTITNGRLADDVTITIPGTTGTVALASDIPVLDGKVKAEGDDASEYLAKKFRAGAGIELTLDTPTPITITDEEYATYALFVAGENVASGDRFILQASACDTTDDYFAGVKGSAIAGGDTFEDVDNTSAVYLGNGGSFTRISIAALA